eukprot:gnl/TRDRNA2_/TRDRNA2_168676_c0_seq4.p1 gnl/TRDRNA2_/TRDRNA2_168676_c0~~gnl/TRDRNA2_/TRDRNA2_168676_c0_seq4.p1  ORF type:complete len:490 (+),score=81.23 gnl/TRDRNA2_/TRDRNA2_168676_c0_seq4:313-1782(+)
MRVLAQGLAQQSSTLHSWLLPPLAARIVEFESGQGECMDFISRWQRQSPRSSALTICVRKRPLLKFEVEKGEWDSVEVISRDSAMLTHDGRVTRSGRKLEITHRRFVLDRVWNASTSTQAVYQDVVVPLVKGMLEGSGATLLCMGQTGTGKTYTLCGIIECLMHDLHDRSMEVDFVELYGKKCLDLLANRKEVHLRTDAEGAVHIRGHHVEHLAGSGGLLEVLQAALQLRSAEETERNSASSRSHAICTLRLASGGMLRLVDLAGSERNYETTKMTAAQHRESAHINSSLMALKDCFRAHAACQRGENVKMPFRGSQLTQLLRECFEDPLHRTLVIATVSPTVTDVIHTVNTLRHATLLAKPLADVQTELTVDLPLHLECSGRLKDVPVIDWTPTDVLAWLTVAESGRFAHLVVPPNLDGKMLLKMSPTGLSDLFEGTLRRARVENEGEAWNIQVDNLGQNIGRELFAAARRVAAAQGHWQSVAERGGS